MATGLNHYFARCLFTCAILAGSPAVAGSAPSVVGTSSNGGDSPSASIPTVPAGHPRLYVLPAELQALRKKALDIQFAQEWTVIRYSRTRPVANALHHLLMPGARD